ncbi:MAG: protein phosphatase 2C domain-containing protein [Granulosicoccaceae bacterium]
MILAPLSIQTAALSDCGRHRSVNEDSWISDTQLGLYAIADGMGGHGSGDVASSMATHVIQTIVEQAAQATLSPDVTDLVLRAIGRANSDVFKANQASKIEAGNGMGTTLVGLYAPMPDTNSGIVFNVGDSRLYRLRDSQLTQLTEDHTLLREWQLKNKPGPAPPGNIIMRAIGLFESVECDITPISLQRGDLILMCSDGLSDMLSEAELISILETGKSGSLEALCDELIRQANHNGGIDNITALAATVV